MVPFRSLPRNARTSIAVEPLWSFFGPTVTFFMPLYQKQLGLSEIQMGIVNSVGIATGLFFFMFSAPLANKLGRRTVATCFDFIAWTVSMVIWAFSKSFAWFIAAAITNSVVRIVVVSWNLLISEDANEEQRSTIFGWINVIGTFGGLTALVGGLMIDRLGVLPSMRAIFLIGGAAMSLMFVLRFLGTRETAIGAAMKEKAKGANLLRLVWEQFPKALEALRDSFFLKMTGIFFIANAVMSIDFFRILYLKDVKSLSSVAVSSIPAFTAVTSVVIFFMILPRMKPSHDLKRLENSFLFCFFSQMFFLLIPRGSILAAFIVFPTLQAAYALLQTFRDTVFMNGIEPSLKSERFSLVQSLMFLLSIPVGWLAGLLYTVSPHLPFILACLLYAAGYLLAKSLHAEIAGKAANAGNGSPV